jgi:hypothetical protein
MMEIQAGLKVLNIQEKFKCMVKVKKMNSVKTLKTDEKGITYFSIVLHGEIGVIFFKSVVKNGKVYLDYVTEKEQIEELDKILKGLKS